MKVDPTSYLCDERFTKILISVIKILISLVKISVSYFYIFLTRNSLNHALHCYIYMVHILDMDSLVKVFWSLVLPIGFYFLKLNTIPFPQKVSF